jgi:hypothetical protein
MNIVCFTLSALIRSEWLFVQSHTRRAPCPGMPTFKVSLHINWAFQSRLLKMISQKRRGRQLKLTEMNGWAVPSFVLVHPGFSECNC